MNETNATYEFAVKFDVDADFTSRVTVNKEMRVVLTISNLKMTFQKVVECYVGNFYLFYINTALKAALFGITVIINNFLYNGFDLNWIIKDILKINFIYFKGFELSERENIVFAKITPGWNISWPNGTDGGLAFRQ